MIKRLIVAATAVALILGLLAPAASAASKERPGTVVDALVQRSGTDGPDNNGYDFDLLIVAASAVTVDGSQTVADLLAGTADITLWAPNDRAFVRLARDLGYDGRDEAGAGAFLLENVDNETLFTVLAYHVTPESFPVLKVLRTRTFDTLLPGAQITRQFLTLKDLDPDNRNPRLTLPLNIKAENGSVVHAIDRVLRPADLP